jgi:hypothetical protein
MASRREDSRDSGPDGRESSDGDAVDREPEDSEPKDREPKEEALIVA